MGRRGCSGDGLLRHAPRHMIRGEGCPVKLTRAEFLQIVAGGSAWLVSNGFAQSGVAVRDVARPLPLGDVRLTGGPLKRAQDLNAAYLLSLDPDRMLAFYRTRAGLEAKAAGYTGWDADGRQLTGHIAGHHLSAVSLMFAASGDARFKQRADYIVDELRIVQERQGDGFAGALQGVREAFTEVSQGNIRSSNFDLNGLWSPWYTLHKTFAGLRDAYRHTGNKTALEVEVRFAQWAARYLTPMSDERIQRMLATEFGGMNEMMADLYADTGDKRWLDLSYRFEHDAVLGSAQAWRGSAQRAPRQHASAEARRLRRAIRGYGRQRRSRGRHYILGTGRQSPHLRDRRPRKRRILSRAGSTRRHCRRPHGRNLQRLQHAEADAEALRAAAGHPLRRVPRAGALQSHPRVRWIPATAPPATWCRSAAACAASTPTCNGVSRAASARAWRATRCTASASTTTERHQRRATGRHACG